jgi:hypothetical protein
MTSSRDIIRAAVWVFTRSACALALAAGSPLRALEVVSAGPQAAGSVPAALSLERVSGYYWRQRGPTAEVVEAGSTGSAFVGGHLLGRALAAGETDRLELLVPLARVGGDPRNAKYTLRLRARGASGGGVEPSQGTFVRVLVRSASQGAYGVPTWVEALNRQRTQIIFSPIAPQPTFVDDTGFVEVGRLEIGADGLHETPEFRGSATARREGGGHILWVRLALESAGSAAGTAGEVDLGDLSLLSRFVDFPTVEGPPAGEIGGSGVFRAHASDNHGAGVEYRWLSLRLFESRFEPAVVEADWSLSDTLELTWDRPGLFHLIVMARSAVDHLLTNTAERPLEVLVGPAPPAQITYPLRHGPGAILVSWSPSPGATRYDAERSLDGGRSWTRIYSGAETEVTDDLGAGPYRFRARASAPIDLAIESSSAWREGADGIVEVEEPPAAAPSARIVRIAPDRTESPEEEICFEGGGEDADGAVVAFEWTSSRQGFLSDAAAFCAAGLECGPHRIGLRVRDDAGAWSEPATAVVIVGSVVLAWPLDGCEARDRKGGTIAVPSGDVACVPDRFGRAEGGLHFGAGRVDGGDIPALEGSFSLRLWLRPDAPPDALPDTLPEGGDGAPPAAPAQVIEIRSPPEASEPGAPLAIAWDPVAHALRVEHDGAGVLVEGVAPAWHQLVLSRAGTALAVHLDGALAGETRAGAALGTLYTLGGGFPGALDDVVLERRPLATEEITAALLEGGPSVLVARGARGKDGAPAYAGSSAAALEVHLRTGSGAREALDPESAAAGFRLTGLRVRAAALALEGSVAPAVLDIVSGLRLAARGPGAAGGEDLEDLGPLAPVAPEAQERGGEAVFGLAASGMGLAGALELPPSSTVALVVGAELRPDAPAGSRLRLTLDSPDDVEVEVALPVGSPPRSGTTAAFVAGERRRGRPALTGSELRVAPPPAVRVAATAAARPASAAGSSILHRVRLEVPALEEALDTDVELTGLVYEELEGKSLEGVTRPRLFADRDADGRLEPGELLGEGVIESARGAIRFGGAGASGAEGGGEGGSGAAPLAPLTRRFAPLTATDLVLVAELPLAARPAARSASGAASALAAAGRVGRLLARLAVLLVALAAALAAARAALLARRPALPRSGAALRAAWAASAFAGAALTVLAPLAGCGGGSGGGSSEAPAEVRTIRLGILEPAAIDIRGAESGVRASIDGLPAGGIAGEKFRLDG